MQNVITDQDSFFYQPDTRRDESVIQALTETAERYPRYGFKKLYQVVRRQGTSGTINVFTGFTAC